MGHTMGARQARPPTPQPALRRRSGRRAWRRGGPVPTSRQPRLFGPWPGRPAISCGSMGWSGRAAIWEATHRRGNSDHGPPGCTRLLAGSRVGHVVPAHACQRRHERHARHVHATHLCVNTGMEDGRRCAATEAGTFEASSTISKSNGTASPSPVTSTAGSRVVPSAACHECSGRWQQHMRWGYQMFQCNRPWRRQQLHRQDYHPHTRARARRRTAATPSAQQCAASAIRWVPIANLEVQRLVCANSPEHLGNLCGELVSAAALEDGRRGRTAVDRELCLARRREL